MVQEGGAKGHRSKAAPSEREFFQTVYGEGSRYKIKEVIGKGSYGLVCSALDTYTGEMVAIKRINNVFDNAADALRILRELRFLRLLKHPDIVEIRHIILPPSPTEFDDVFIVFELLETDLHLVIRANDDLTGEHFRFFAYQLLRGLRFIHRAGVYHRDLKPKNILANADCKIKICDFGLARFANNPSGSNEQLHFWTDYIATRWYRAPELCGSFFARYTPAIDVWGVGCIFAELLSGKPLFPGKNAVHQLNLITDLLGSPTPEVLARVKNEKARKYLQGLPQKQPQSLAHRFPKADAEALRILGRMLTFDPDARPSCEELLADPYFDSLRGHDAAAAAAEAEDSLPRGGLSRMDWTFEAKALKVEQLRELMYDEIALYHPDLPPRGNGSCFNFPSAIDAFKRQFAFLEMGGSSSGNGGGKVLLNKSQSLPKEAATSMLDDGVLDVAKHLQPAIEPIAEEPPRG